MTFVSTSRLTYAPSLVLPVSERDHVLGGLDAPAVLVEYGDYECPYCGAAYPSVAEVKRRLGGNLALVYRHFPLSNVHPHAWKAAEAAEAAGAQGKFWEMHDQLYRHQDALSGTHVARYAADLDLDLDRFVEELATGVHAGRVNEDFRSGILSGVNGTPTFFVNGIRHEGGYDPESLMAALGV